MGNIPESYIAASSENRVSKMTWNTSSRAVLLISSMLEKEVSK